VPWREQGAAAAFVVAVVAAAPVLRRSSSPASLGAIALTLLPAVSIILGTVLVDRGRRIAGFAVYLLLVLTPLAPTLYLDPLPYYRLDSYPVLDDALLRPATASTAPRVCYVYGVFFGPRKLVVRPDTPRTCVDLKRTPQALSLTAGYDGGRTGFDLEVMGHNLTEKGLPVHPGDTGVNGLTVDRVYKLTDSQAQIEAKRVF